MELHSIDSEIKKIKDNPEKMADTVVAIIDELTQNIKDVTSKYYEQGVPSIVLGMAVKEFGDRLHMIDKMADKMAFAVAKDDNLRKQVDIDPTEGFYKVLDKLKKDTLFIFSSDVEPLTGIFYPLDLIREEVLKKNFYILNYQ